MRKFKLTKTTMVKYRITFYQIISLKDFSNVKKGELGGWITREENVSQYGNAWVSDNACVSGDACVYGNAQVSGNAWVSDNAWVSGNAQVSGDARVVTKVINLIAACEFSVTAYCKFVQIGCKLHTQKEWKEIFRAGTYKGLCHNEKSYLQCKAAFEYCLTVMESRKDIER